MGNGLIITEMTFIEFVNFAIALSIIFSGFMMLFYVIRGGITAIMSGGDGEKMKEGLHGIRHSIIGFMIVIFAVVVVKFIGQFVGVDFLAQINANDIMSVFYQILDRLNTSGGGQGF